MERKRERGTFKEGGVYGRWNTKRLTLWVRLVMAVTLKNLLLKKICRIFSVALDFIALEFYRKLQKIVLDFWLCRALVQL